MKFHHHFLQRSVSAGCRSLSLNCPFRVSRSSCALQPKARTSSEESMASEEDRSRKPSSLHTPAPPTPLSRTSSGTHVRPASHSRASRHSGEPSLLHSGGLRERFHRNSSLVLSHLYDPDSTFLAVRVTDPPADDLPPELPPKGIRRRQLPPKVRVRIKSL